MSYLAPMIRATYTTQLLRSCVRGHLSQFCSPSDNGVWGGFEDDGYEGTGYGDTIPC